MSKTEGKIEDETCLCNKEERRVGVSQWTKSNRQDRTPRQSSHCQVLKTLCARLRERRVGWIAYLPSFDLGFAIGITQTNRMAWTVETGSSEDGYAQGKILAGRRGGGRREEGRYSHQWSVVQATPSVWQQDVLSTLVQARCK